MFRNHRFVWILLLVSLIGSPALAAVCGDNVGGQDIPCGCGDTVVSSLVLTDDPVTTERCKRHGLIVSAGRTQTGVEIDLNGKTLRGSGKGAGLWVTSGGRDGVRIVSNNGQALIEGFRDGIAGRTRGTVNTIDNVILSGSVRDGVHVFSDRVQIRDSQAYNSGRDGFYVRGEAWMLKDLRASNSRRHGIKALGEAGTLGVNRSGVTVESSGGTGISVMGIGHRVIDCVAIGGRADGVETTGAYHEVTGCLAVDNDGVGIKGSSHFSRVRNCRAEHNFQGGILFVDSGALDGGGNVGLENGETGTGAVAKQCEIGGAPCQ
jgi:hypothetical protein